MTTAMDVPPLNQESPTATGAGGARGVAATFVFADLAGYTALTEAHGDEHAADTAAEFCRAVRTLMEDYRAQEVKTIGDALLLRVPEPDQAVHLAARLVGDYGVRHRSLGIRIGMHTGVAVCRDGDWFGAAVNLASRIADVAAAGEVLLSQATRTAVGDAILPGQLRSRGRRHMKNVGEPVELFALVSEELDQQRLPVDPVCRMAIDPALVEHRAVHSGIEYQFCSQGCAEAFAHAPGRYAGRRSRRAALLVSDDARDSAARRVARAFARGRIEADELEERVALVWSARTRADLRAATRDLPRKPRSVSPFLWPVWPLVLMYRRTRRRVRRLHQADRAQLGP